MSTDATIQYQYAVSPQNLDYPDSEPFFPPDGDDLISDDGEPLESNRHRIAMNALIDSTTQHLGDRQDYFTGGNMFIYFSSHQVKNRDFRGPDYFVVFDVDGTKSRKNWTIWSEDGRYPDIIVELMSDTTRNIDLNEKKKIYERTFKTPYYFVYDPFDPESLQGWKLDAHQRYQPIQPDERGWLWCELLGVWLGIWEGQICREPPSENCFWLRFYDQEGNLIPLPKELAEAEQQRAEQERQRAEQERQRAEQEQQRAEQERQRAEQEQQRAEQEQQRAEQERQRAEQERQRAEQERQRADEQQRLREELLQKLMDKGINIDEL
jgi:Uma2 family endonuclease